MPTIPATIEPALSGATRLILNGQAAADLLLREAVETLRGAGHALDARVIWEPGDAAVFAAEAAEAGVARIVAAGGDGTLNEAINGLFLAGPEPQTAVGILPYGTANDFATACGISPQDPAAMLRFALEAEPVPIDVGRANERFFLNVASGGYPAEVTTETTAEAKQILGGFAYFLTGLTSAATVTARPTRLQAPDFQWEGDILGITVSNGRQAGGGFRVAPSAWLDDGLLDVMVIPHVTWGEFVALASELLRVESRLGSEHILYRQCSWLEIEAPEGLQVNVDGEPLFSTHFRFEALPRRLRCCLPQTAPLTAPLPVTTPSR